MRVPNLCPPAILILDEEADLAADYVQALRDENLSVIEGRDLADALGQFDHQMGLDVVVVTTWLPDYSSSYLIDCMHENPHFANIQVIDKSGNPVTDLAAKKRHHHWMPVSKLSQARKRWKRSPRRKSVFDVAKPTRRA